jgi:hypothetical protein
MRRVSRPVGSRGSLPAELALGVTTRVEVKEYWVLQGGCRRIEGQVGRGPAE